MGSHFHPDRSLPRPPYNPGRPDFPGHMCSSTYDMGKPAVRNFRGGNGNVGIIRSPVRAIALPDIGRRAYGRARLYFAVESWARTRRTEVRGSFNPRAISAAQTSRFGKTG